MNMRVISLSILLISCYIHVTSGIFWSFLRYQLAMDGHRNSFYNSEIQIEGAKAEDIYFMERADQLKQMDNLQKKREELVKKKKAAKKISVFDLNPAKAAQKVANIGRLEFQIHQNDKKIGKLEKELATNKFCSMPDICNRAFKHSFFTKKNNWILKDADTIETKCVDKNIVVAREGKNFADMRKYVKCETKSDKDGEKSPVAFLEASTRLVAGKNLKYFVLLDKDDDGYVKPVAYLMNTKELDSIEIPITDEEKPLLGDKASKKDVQS